jgi:hypothetical protein
MSSPWFQKQNDERRKRTEAERMRAIEERERVEREAEYESLLTKCRDLVGKFLEIAERKVSVLDDYGDENWDALPLRKSTSV